MFVRSKAILIRSRGEGRLFLYFYIFMKAIKISVLEEWAELVASQLTQYLIMQIKSKLEKISGGE